MTTAAYDDQTTHALAWIERSAGIPRRNLPNRFETFDTPTDEHKLTLAAVREFSSQPGDTTLILAGIPGSGKTHLAVSGMWDNPLAYPLYTNASAILLSIKSTWGQRYPDQQTEEQILHRLTSARLLVIDDLGCGHSAGDFERRIFEHIVCTRYDDTRPTIIVTNLAVDQMKTLIGARASDRLAETGQVVISPPVSRRRQRGI